MKRASIALLALLLAPACATTGAFGTTFPTGGDRLKQTLARAHAAATPAGTPVVVGVADAPRAVFAYDLSSGRMLFRQSAQVVGLPCVAGELVAVPEATQVTIRRLRDGKVIEELPLDGMHLIGADGDANASVVVLSTGGTMNARSRLVMLRGETVSADQKVSRALGVPAMLGGIAFVPHNRVHVSAIDAGGNELARARILDDVSSAAFARDGNVYLGQRGFYQLDETTERGPKNGAHYWRLNLVNKLPGAPPLLPDSTEAAPAIESALYRVRLSFAPASGAAGLGLLDDALYLAFYRQLFALSPDGGKARWVHETDSDVVGIRAIAGGLLAVESSGEVTALDGEGNARFQANMGILPIAVNIRAERFDQGSASGEAQPLAAALERAAHNPDTRLVPSRAFAATLLGAVPDDQAAQGLIKLCGDEDTPTRVRSEACDTLAKRQELSDAVLAALGTHANFLAGTPAPPVAALAQAALRSGDRRAVPALLAQLNDPAASVEDVAAIMRALGALGDSASAKAIAAFLRLYHADSADEDFETALALGMEALVKLDKERARGVLDAIGNDSFARVGVRTAAQRRLAELPSVAVSDEAGGAAGTPSTASKETASDTAPAPEGPPTHLTSQHVDDALSAVRAKLSRCVDDAPQHPSSARLVIVIDGEGAVVDVKSLPESVQPCIGPLVRDAKFPATKYGRRSVMTYFVSR